MPARYRWANVIIVAALFLAAVCLYTLTLNPDVQPADSGELQIAAILLGIPHPPGYPLFTMLGWLFAQAPIATPFARVSFLSVVASAGTLVLVCLSIQTLQFWQDIPPDACRHGADCRAGAGDEHNILGAGDDHQYPQPDSILHGSHDLCGGAHLYAYARFNAGGTSK